MGKEIKPGDLEFERDFWRRASAGGSPYGLIRTGWSWLDFGLREDETSLWMFDFNLAKDDVFIDLGCGAGYICKMVAPRVARYIGVDFAEGMLQCAKRDNAAFQNASWILNDGKTIPLPDNSATVLVAELLMQHVEYPVAQSLVKESLRVLKPDGRYCIQVVHDEPYDKRVRWTRDECIAVCGTDGFCDGGTYYYMTRGLLPGRDRVAS